MKYWIAFGIVGLLTLAAACASGQEIEPKIILPLNPVQPVPIEPVVPLPVPPPQPPRVVDTLSIDQIWVVESTVELFVRQYPTGLLEVDSEAGPIRVRGKFADGSGSNETREYKADHVYLITAAKSGVVMLDLVPSGVTVESDIVRQVLTVSGVGPQPPPIPPGPTPDPGPTPQPGTGKRALIVYESSDLGKLPPSQAVLITSGNVRDYLHRVCDKGPDGRSSEWRVWDKDTDLTNVTQPWREAMALPRTSLPWLIVSNGTTGFSGPLPADEAALMAKLKQYLGE